MHEGFDTFLKNSMALLRQEADVDVMDLHDLCKAALADLGPSSTDPGSEKHDCSDVVDGFHVFSKEVQILSSTGVHSCAASVDSCRHTSDLDDAHEDFDTFLGKLKALLRQGTDVDVMGLHALCKDALADLGLSSTDPGNDKHDYSDVAHERFHVFFGDLQQQLLPHQGVLVGTLNRTQLHFPTESDESNDLFDESDVSHGHLDGSGESCEDPWADMDIDEYEGMLADCRLEALSGYSRHFEVEGH